LISFFKYVFCKSYIEFNLRFSSYICRQSSKNYTVKASLKFLFIEKDDLEMYLNPYFIPCLETRIYDLKARNKLLGNMDARNKLPGNMDARNKLPGNMDARNKLLGNMDA